ncbi:MAG: long-chain fatty acid--CoA ligase [Armatimonadetes bacterium]|nr:long-chain fatty acid--CoA ligase [Armatimonadota bacterium]
MSQPLNIPDLNTVNRRFADAARRHAARPALSEREGKGWHTLTYAEVELRVRRFALGLRALGVGPGDRVALLSENRSEWTITDLAAQAAGAVSVPIYPTLPPSQVAHILADSGARAIVVSDAKQLQKVTKARGQAPGLSILVAMEESAAQGDVHSFEAVMQEGDAARVDDFAVVRDSVGPDDLMSIIYTSGTTGNPKGVMLTHDCLCAFLDGARIEFTQFDPPDEVFLSFLPLCHIYERVVSTLALANGAHTYYNDSIFRLVDNMAETRPSVMTNVPRVYESIHERILAEAAKLPPKRQAAFRWAAEVGERVALRRNAGKSLGPLWPLQYQMADKLVLSKLRAKFGGRLKFFVTGGAPLNPKTGAFFQALGAPILEGWGLTETTGPATVNPYGRVKLGTVGTAFPACEVRIADDGEMLVRGRTVMRGYWNNPEATAEALDSEGWFHSGDIGQVDTEGYFQITDRKKDLLVLANGKKVAPQPIETRLKHSPYIADVVLLGDQAGSVSALVLPAFDKLRDWAKEQGKDPKDMAALAADPAVRKLFKQEIDAHAGELADFEKIKRHALLPAPLSIESGELTPTLKIKRKVVAEKYGNLLEKE